MSEPQSQAAGPPTGKPAHASADAHPTEVSSVADPTRAGSGPQRDATSTPPTVSDALRGPPIPLEPGVLFGVYRLEKKLGEGGMGTVWKALHTRLEKHVALKVLPQYFSRDAGMIARFDREMKAVGKLDHPHIVRAMDAGEVQGTHFLAMEYLDGVDLNQVVKQNGPRLVAEACEMMRQAALGLAYAHQNGLIHRDIKPTNLFLAKPGRVKVLDLGLARLHGESLSIEPDGPLTRSGQVLGTPEYMAPEQWDDTHAADGRADLYALGCTLFFLLTGRAPFSDEKHASLIRKMKGHTSEAPPDLRRERAETPEAVCAVYQRLMAKAPEERYATADELASVLMGIVKQLSSGAPAEPPVPAAPAKPPATKPAAPERTKPIASKKSSPKRETADPDTEWTFEPAPMPGARGRTPARRPAAGGQGRSASRGMSSQTKAMLGGGAVAAVLLVFAISYMLGKGGTKDSPPAPSGDQTSNTGATTGNTVGKTAETPPDANSGTTTKPQVDPDKPWAKVEPHTPDLKPDPVLFKSGDRLGPTALVARPAALPGLLSWTIEPIGPSSAARSAGVSDDGRLMATWGMNDCAIRLWEAVGEPPAEFKLKSVLFGQSTPPPSISFSPDNKLLACTSTYTVNGWNSDTILWDIATGRKTRTITTFSGQFVSWSPDGGRLAVYGPYGLTTINFRTNQTREFRAVGGDGRDMPLAISASWSPDGTQLVTGGRKMRLWEADTLGVIHEWPYNEKGPAVVAWSLDGKRIASFAPEKSLTIWNVRTRELERGIEVGGTFYGSGPPPWIAWLNDSRRVAVAMGPRGYILHDADTGRMLADMPPANPPMAVAWTRDGRYAVTSGVEPPGYYNGSTTLRDGDTWGIRATLPRIGRVEHLLSSLSADGRRLATRNLSGVAAWDADNGRLLQRWPLADSGMISISPKGDWIAAFSSITTDDSLVLFDPIGGRQQRPLANQSLGVQQFAWSAEGDRFAVAGSDKQIRIFKTADGKLQKTLDGHEAEILSLAWASDSKRLASVSTDGVLHVWDPTQTRPVATHKDLPSKPSTYYRGGSILAFSADRQRLIIALESDMADLDLKSGKVTVRDDAKDTRSIRQFVTGRDDKSIAVSRSNQTVFEEDGKERRVFPFDGIPMLPADGRRLLIHINYATIPCVQAIAAFESESGREIGAFLPHLSDNNHVCISADGHYQGSRDIDQHIVYVALREDGSQAIYTPTEFTRKFGWKNDVLKATLKAPGQ